MKKFTVMFLALLLCVYLCGCGGPQEVSSMDCTVTILGHTFNGQYTGTIENKVPNGQGSFYFSDSKYNISYTGQWENGLPSGEGKLESLGMVTEIGNSAPRSDMPPYYATDAHKTPYLDYTGEWTEGNISGQGTIRTNLYTIKFYDDVIRTGEYMGETLNGLADGNGIYAAKNDSGIQYTYSGEWKSGLFNGYGEQKYDADNYYTRIGTFTNGKFTPTPLDFFITKGTIPNETYTISEKAKSFLLNHPDIFLNNEIGDETIEYEEKFKYTTYAKSPENYGSKLLTLSNLKVVQIFEDQNWDKDTTFIIATDGSGNVYSINMYGKLDGIYENSRIKITVLPLDYFTYPNVSGTSIWAIACAGVKLD